MNFTDDHPTRPGMDEVLLRYFRAADEGRPVRPEALIEEYPHLAGELRAFFSGEALLAPLSSPGTTPGQAPTTEAADTPPELAGLLVEEELGRGGIGVVYRARDPRLGRDLAVKVLRVRFREDPDARRRFVEEAQICAQLQHPGVVPVHARGTLADGRPYFAMKLIRGRTLRALLAERPTPLDDLPRFLGVFEQVCQTVAYAHGQRVLHRDLKPENVMVGPFGEVQVMDWGLAKVLTRSGYTYPAHETPPIQTVRSDDEAADTGAGRAMGTPAYMPPEQANGRGEERDERCDVFALGAILCDVLTGLPPYHGEYLEVLERVRTGDVRDALARLDACGADADLIALTRRCLASDPGSRPGSAAEVAAALRAYKDGLAERLRRTELERTAAAAREAEAIRAVSAERRARRRTAALAVAMVVLLAGAGGAAWVHDQQRQQKAREEAGRRQALEREIAREVGEVSALVEQGKHLRDQPERWGLLLRTARAAFGRAERLLDAPETTDDLRQAVAETRTALEEAERAQRLLTQVERARNGLADSRGGHWNTAALSQQFHKAFKDFGLDLLQGDREELVRRVGEHPLREWLLDALQEWLILSADLEVRERLGEVLLAADSNVDSIRRRSREAFGRGDMPALQALARSDEARKLSPSATVTLVTLIHILGNLSGLLAHVPGNGDKPDLRLFSSRDLPSHYEGRGEALALLRHALVRHPDDFWINHTLTMILDNGDPKERDEALRHAAVSVALRPDSAAARYSLGLALSHRNDDDGAEACYRKAIELDHQELRATINLGLLRLRRGHTAEAVKLLGSARDQAPHHGKTHTLMGFALAAAGQNDDALVSMRQGVELDRKSVAAHVALGMELRRQQKRPEAQQTLRDALRLDPNDAEANVLLGDLLREGHDHREAEECYRRALANSARMSPERLATVHQGLARAQASLGDRKAALASIRTAAELDRADPSIQAHLKRMQAEDATARKEAVVFLKEQAQLHASNPRVLEELGDACQDTGDLAAAEQAYRRCIELNESNVVPRVKLGAIQLARKDYRGAEETLSKAVKLDPKYGPGQIYLAAVLFERGDFARARTANRLGLELVPRHPTGLENSALLLEQSGDLSGAIKAYAEAVEQAPGDAALRCRLATKLSQRGEYRAALVEFVRAQQADERYAPALMGEARVRVALRDVDGAVKALRKLNAVEKNAEGLQLLGSLLLTRGEWKGYAAAMRDLADIDQAAAPVALVQLADCLLMTGDMAEAEKVSRRAVELAPTQPAAHYSLGKSLMRARKYDEAAKSYAEAVRLAPRVAELHFALGGVYHMQGDYKAAARSFEEATNLARPGEPRREFHAMQKRYMERILELQPKVEGLLKADKLPQSYDDLLALGDLCEKEPVFRPRAAVRIYTEAFALRPELADEVVTGHRMRAASAAIQAAAGKGNDVADLDDTERARLRRQALKWLRADLKIYTQGFETLPPQARSVLLTGLVELKIEPRLAPVRDRDGLASLPEDDREPWKKFWTDVDALLKRIDDASR